MVHAEPHLDCLESPDTLQQELSIWYAKFSNLKEVPATLREAYLCAESSINFPNIQYLLKVVLTMPVTSASTDRANSTLKFIKTKLRSTLSQHALNAFVLGYKHKDILNKLKLDALYSTFVGMKRRRLLLLNPLLE